MENLIETTGLCKRYEDFSLEGVNLTVPARTLVGRKRRRQNHHPENPVGNGTTHAGQRTIAGQGAR